VRQHHYVDDHPTLVLALQGAAPFDTVYVGERAVEGGEEGAWRDFEDSAGTPVDHGRW
jgi:hypothetical protein